MGSESGFDVPECDHHYNDLTPIHNYTRADGEVRWVFRCDGCGRQVYDTAISDFTVYEALFQYQAPEQHS
jgi:hypothetical protein